MFAMFPWHMFATSIVSETAMRFTTFPSARLGMWSEGCDGRGDFALSQVAPVWGTVWCGLRRLGLWPSIGLLGCAIRPNQAARTFDAGELSLVWIKAFDVRVFASDAGRVPLRQVAQWQFGVFKCCMLVLAVKSCSVRLVAKSASLCICHRHQPQYWCLGDRLVDWAKHLHCGLESCFTPCHGNPREVPWDVLSCACLSSWGGVWPWSWSEPLLSSSPLGPTGGREVLSTYS